MCKDFFLEILEKIKKLAETGVVLSSNSPDHIIFKYAMKQAEKAANKELILLFDKSFELYNVSISLLKYLKRNISDVDGQVSEGKILFLFY